MFEMVLAVFVLVACVWFFVAGYRGTLIKGITEDVLKAKENVEREEKP